jgi:hypothetical protein
MGTSRSGKSRSEDQWALDEHELINDAEDHSRQVQG